LAGLVNVYLIKLPGRGPAIVSCCCTISSL